MEVFERLKASKARHNDDMRLKGLEDGRFWAMKFAEFYELRRLADARDADNRLLDAQSAWQLQVRLFSVIAPDVDYSVQAVEAFWVETVGEDNRYLLDELSYVMGFAEGALEVYDGVEAKL